MHGRYLQIYPQYANMRQARAAAAIGRDQNTAQAALIMRVSLAAGMGRCRGVFPSLARGGRSGRGGAWQLPTIMGPLVFNR